MNVDGKPTTSGAALVRKYFRVRVPKWPFAFGTIRRWSIRTRGVSFEKYPKAFRKIRGNVLLAKLLAKIGHFFLKIGTFFCQLSTIFFDFGEFVFKEEE